MDTRTEREMLNRLIEICKDGERGFHTAAQHVGDGTLKALLLELSTQRAAFAAELVPHAQRLGGAETSDGTSAGALHRSWMNLKGMLTGHQDDTVLGEAVRGEEAALAAYKDALASVLPPTVTDLVERQYAAVKDAAARVAAFEFARRNA
ncbi:MAG: PA2169 family four-helix-bundle protein [Vicinamibacterales bacterium]